MTKCSYLIPLTKGYHAIVDKDGYKKVKNYKWRAKIEGKQGQYIYAFNNKLGRMHRYIMNYPENMIDHANRNTLDNRTENLRIVTNRQNQQNRKRKYSNLPGVTWHKKHKKWYAQINIKGKQRYLGYFDNEKEASKAYKKACNGEYL